MNTNLPKISIVTPSFNQGKYLEDTILSVISQNYPNLEYIIIDGGSSDNSVEVIKKYEHYLKYWVSEPDNGQYDAINKGFSMASGEILAWLNSDDKYTPWTFQIIAAVFSKFPEIQWGTTLYPLEWNEHGDATGCSYIEGYSRAGFLKGENLPGNGWYAKVCIQQESTFFRKSLWDRSGGAIDTTYRLAGDFELWARFFQYSELYGIGTPIAGFRRHGDQKTAKFLQEYMKEAKCILSNYGGHPHGRISSYILRKKFVYLIGPIRRLSLKLGLINLSKICVYAGREDGWKIQVI